MFLHNSVDIQVEAGHIILVFLKLMVIIHKQDVSQLYDTWLDSL